MSGNGAVFTPTVHQADDGTTLVQIDPRDAVIGDHPIVFKIAYRGPVFARVVGPERTALSYLDIVRLNNTAVVRFREMA